MRWVIDQRTPLPDHVQAVLTHGQQVAGDTLQIRPATLARDACDVFVQPDPFANEPALVAHFFQPHIRRWAYVETWPTPTRTNLARYVWLKRFHTIITPDVEAGQHWLKNADVRWLTPEETWRAFAPSVAPVRPTPRVTVIASAFTDTMDNRNPWGEQVLHFACTMLESARVDTVLAKRRDAIRQASQPCDARIFVVADGAEHAWVYELARRLGGVLVVYGEGLGNLWHERYGLAATATLASRELGRTVSTAEMRLWLQEPHTCPVRLLDGAERVTWFCSPLSVSERGAGGVRSALPRAAVDLTPQPPLRNREGEPESEYAKGTRILLHAPTPEVIQALDLLASWSFPFHATWYGVLPKSLRLLVRRYGLQKHMTDGCREALPIVLHDTDVAFFWRPFARGGPAPELLWCRDFGVPAICVEAEARLLGEPGFLRAVPDRLSPLLIAEAIVEASSWSKADVRAACEAHEETYAASAVAARLLQALGLHG